MKSSAGYVILIIAVLACLFVNGCESMWNRANKGFVERDLRMLLDEKCRVRIAKLDCRMLGTTRNAVATFEASSEQIGAMIKGLGLQEAIEGSEEESFLKGVLNSASHKDLAELEPFSGEEVKWYCSKRRSEKLVMGNDLSFEYFILIVGPALDTVCVLFSYAYG